MPLDQYSVLSETPVTRRLSALCRGVRKGRERCQERPFCQQGLYAAYALDRHPNLLLIGQPTRGVDIGAIEFRHRRLVALRDAGKAIVLVSVELDEILALADRILVIHDGQIAGELPRAAATERTLGLLMAGVSDPAGSAAP